MGLSFAALTDAALGGGAAWNVGKREGRADKIKENQTAAALQRQATLDQMNAALHESQIAENEAQRQEALQRAAKLKYDLEHPKPVAPVLGTPEYRKAMGELESDKAKNRPKQEWEVYGPSGDRAGGGGVSAGEVRKTKAAEDFAARYVDAYQGNAPAAVAYIESHPELKATAARLGVTQAHYNAATARRSSLRPGTQKPGTSASDELDSLAGDGAPVATAPSSAPQPKRALAETPTARALESTIPTVAPVVVRPDNRNGTGTSQGQKAPAPAQPTSTPRSNPLRANSPKAGTQETPAGADPEKYRNDPRYRRWVDSLTTKR